MLTKTCIAVSLLFAQFAFGHPESKDPVEIRRRELEMRELTEMATHCSNEVAAYNKLRRARRAARSKRSVFEEDPKFNLAAVVQEDPIKPHFETIQNLTCIAAPEVDEGPYHLKNELIRQDLRETQGGVPLYLDIGVLDISSCKPVNHSFVEIWSANATGLYSSFTTSAVPPPFQYYPKTDKLNHLRGGYWSDANGMVELVTIFPGYYTGRAVHIHTMVHQNIQTSANGTIISTTGNTRHIGQVYFPDSLIDEVLTQKAYQGTGMTLTRNRNDVFWTNANSNRYNPYPEITRLGSGIADGLLAYITIGINANSNVRIGTPNYYK